MSARHIVGTGCGLVSQLFIAVVGLHVDAPLGTLENS